jgi:serine/threonine-protein kinase HipA
VSFLKLFAVQTSNDELYRLKLLQWTTFNILTQNYDAHGKNISFFVSKRGLELTPFYDLVNIGAIITEIQKRQNDQGIVKEDRNHSISQHYAMSIGSFEPGSVGHFQNPITAYMLADFATQFGISLPRIQLVMSQFTNSVLAAIDISRQEACELNLTAEEVAHIELCIVIIRQAADELLHEIARIPDMLDLV